MGEAGIIDVEVAVVGAGLSGLTAADVEAFVQIKSRENNRQSLQHIVAHLRAFLRYCADHGEAPGGGNGLGDHAIGQVEASRPLGVTVEVERASGNSREPLLAEPKRHSPKKG